MKKVGIFTYWGVPNYGAWVQAYALNNIIKNIMESDDEVLHVNYLENIHWNSYYKNDIQLYNAFSYNWDEIGHSPLLTTEELENIKYDYFVTGSDSIWEFSNCNMGNDKHLVGINIKADKIISYAASFGTTNITELSAWVKSGLKKYSKITVRDNHSKLIVDDMLGKGHCDVVLDPALLYNFPGDEKVKDPRYKKYIAVYGAEFDEEFIKETIQYARSRGLELISIGYINNWCDRSIKMLELRTFEWLGFIKNADLIVTSMFHGLMVSLSYNKQVKFDQVSYVKNRSQTLLELLGIQMNIGSFGKLIDYKVVNKKLDDLRANSINILRDSLKDNG